MKKAIAVDDPTCGNSPYGVTCTQPSPANMKSLSLITASRHRVALSFPTNAGRARNPIQSLTEAQSLLNTSVDSVPL